MNMLPVLRIMEKLEMSAAALYRWFSEVFSGDEEASTLFYRLSVEGDGHTNLVRFILRLVGKTPLDDSDIELDLARMEQVIAEIHRIQTLANFSLEQAVQFSVALESQVFEYHSRQTVIQALPAIGPLVFSLGRDDKGHTLLLTRFARKRGFLPDTPPDNSPSYSTLPNCPKPNETAAI